MLRSGTTLGGRYVLIEAVARGGMGQVWRADDTVLNRIVAVKVLLSTLSEDPEFAERFRSEARAMAALSHPGIVEVHDFGEADGVSYLVMQFVEGESLRSLLEREGPLSPARTMRLVGQAAQALHHAHTVGIVHRDVKPGNLLVRWDGRVVLTDFGIARVASQAPTTSGQVVGTAAYLAPEQVLGEPVEAATDVYALGVVAYECLTLTRPFVADTAVAVALMHTRAEPPALPAGIPPAVRRVVMRALAKEPANRWSSAADLARAATTLARAGDTRGGRAGDTLTGKPDDTHSGRAVGTVADRAPARSRGGRRRRVVAALAAVAAVAAGMTALVLTHASATGREAHTITGVGSLGEPHADVRTPLVAASGTGGPLPGTSPAATSRGPVAARATPAPTRATHTKPPPSAAPTPTSTLVPVPNVLNQQEQFAEGQIQMAGLVPQVSYEFSAGTCTVLRQNPAPNTPVSPNTNVYLVVDRDPTKQCNEPLPP